MGKLLYPYLTVGFKKGVEQTTSTLSVDEVWTLGVQAHLKKWSFEKAKFVTETTKGILKDLLQEAIDQGKGSAELGRDIRKQYDDMTPKRSLTVARTELTGAINSGTSATLRAEGHETKEWSTVIDGRERESHHKANGQTVPIDHPFKLDGGSGMYPGDPMLPASEVIQCRCTTVAGGLSSDRKAALGRAFLRTHGSLERKLVVALGQYLRGQRDRILSRL